MAHYEKQVEWVEHKVTSIHIFLQEILTWVLFMRGSNCFYEMSHHKNIRKFTHEDTSLNHWNALSFCLSQPQRSDSFGKSCLFLQQINLVLHIVLKLHGYLLIYSLFGKCYSLNFDRRRMLYTVARQNLSPPISMYGKTSPSVRLRAYTNTWIKHILVWFEVWLHDFDKNLGYYYDISHSAKHWPIMETEEYAPQYYKNAQNSYWRPREQHILNSSHFLSVSSYLWLHLVAVCLKMEKLSGKIFKKNCMFL